MCNCAQMGVPSNVGGHLPSCGQYYNPRGANQPNTDPKVCASGSPLTTLTEELGAVADDMRQLNTDFGIRPYRMFSVVYQWTGGEVGRGEPQLIFEEEFLPTPKLTLVGLVDRGYIRASVEEVAEAGGSVERGTISVIEISPRYTEDQINWLFRQGGDLDPGQIAFIEIAMDQRDGLAPRRRFTVSSVPQRNADKFYWSVELIRQELDRDRFGNPIDSATGLPPGAATPVWAR